MTYKYKIPPTAKDTICLLYRQGKTLQEIGDLFGATRERVRQLLRKYGVDQETGGSHIRGFVNQSELHRKKLERAAKRVAKTEALFGCCQEEIVRISGTDVAPWMQRQKRLKTPVAAYLAQRNNAKKRKIPWSMSLTEWWRIWQESGHWEERGRGKGYCMARHGDSGPYSIENVYICTTGQNFSDSYLVHPWHERFPDACKRGPDGLSKAERQVTRLRKEGLSWREIAKRLKKPKGSICWTSWHAKRKLALAEAA